MTQDKRNAGHIGHVEAAGSKTDSRRPSETSSSSPQPKSTWMAPRSAGDSGTTGQTSAALPRSVNTNENWAPPLPPPSLLDPPPPPRRGSGASTTHDAYTQQPGVPPVPPDASLHERVSTGRAYGASSSVGVPNARYLPQVCSSAHHLWLCSNGFILASSVESLRRRPTFLPSPCMQAETDFLSKKDWEEHLHSFAGSSQRKYYFARLK